MAKDSLSALQSAISLEDHDLALKLAEDILKNTASDATAQRARIVALLNLDRYEEAIQAIEKSEKSFQQECALEYSYALYRRGRVQDAINTIRDQSFPGSKHLLSQAYYRLEEFEKSAAIYKELLSQPSLSEHEENDTVINCSAVQAQLAWKGLDGSVALGLEEYDDLESFESSFNAACTALGRGELAEGEALLKKAQGLCLSSPLLDEQEKSAELLPILEQKVYALLAAGNLAEAKPLAQAVLGKDITDQSLRTIAEINYTVAERREGIENPYIVHRKLHEKSKVTALKEPFRFQSNLITKNQSIALSSAPKGKDSGLILSGASSGPQVISSYVAAAAVVHGKPPAKAIRDLLPHLTKHPKDLGAALLVAQLHIHNHNPSQALAVLTTLTRALDASDSPVDRAARFTPALVGLLTTLHQSTARTAARRAEFARYARHLHAHPTAPAPLALLLAAAAALLASRDPTDLALADRLFRAAAAVDPANPTARAGRAAAAAALAPSAPPDPAPYRPIATLVATVDAAALERAGIPAPATATAAPAAGVAKRARLADRTVPTPRKRVRAGRMPKEFVEGKEMDPERWLPLRDRSYWKPKGRKGKKKADAATQGGVVEDEGAQRSGVVGGGGGGKKKGKKGKR